jgi:hypothetical protein
MNAAEFCTRRKPSPVQIITSHFKIAGFAPRIPLDPLGEKDQRAKSF